jgi:uncharacterized protein (DUF58 family)
VIRGLPFFFSTRFFLLFGSASALLVPLYLAYPSGILLPLAADGILVLAAVLDFLVAPSPRKMQLRRPLPYPLAVDRTQKITIEASNGTGRPVSILVRDDVPGQCRVESWPSKMIVNTGSLAHVDYRLTPLERGEGMFGNIHFWLEGPMGLVWKRGEAPAAAKVKLYPGLALIGDRKLGMWRPIAHDPIRALRKASAGTDFDSLREYVVGDDARLIHWGTTARTGTPMVRQNRMERSQTVFLVLDAGRMMTARVLGRTKLDHGLNAALLVAYAALELGDKVGVMMVGQEILCFLPPDNMRTQFGRILDATYALKPRMEEPRFYLALSSLASRLKRRSLVIIVTDLIDERASEGLMRYILGLLPRHLPLVVAISDTELIGLAESIPRDKRDLYRQGVAAGILDRRERLMAKLGSRGVLVLDTPPEKISLRLLDRYLDIKTRNRL